MTTGGTSPHEENAQETALLKEQVAEMMHMMKQLVVRGGQNSSCHSQGGLQTENENYPLPRQDQPQYTTSGQ